MSPPPPPPPPPPPREPVILVGIGTDAVNSFEDLSGLPTAPAPRRPKPFMSTVLDKNENTIHQDLRDQGVEMWSNPYDVLIEACENDPAKIQSAYQTHRSNRNDAQRIRLTSPDFAGIAVDPILKELCKFYRHTRAFNDANININYSDSDSNYGPNTIDPRNCLVFWARPPTAVMDLIGIVQSQLQTLAPRLWLMPRDCLHMTVLEITHSTTAQFINELVERMGRAALEGIVNTPQDPGKRARLVRPLLSFDAAALALSFVPVAPAGTAGNGGGGGSDGSSYTYHHLRRDLYEMSRQAGVGVTSRYIVPSAHITVARFVTAEDHEEAPGVVDRKRMQEWIDLVGGINKEIENWDYEWVVGQERGIDCRRGQLWYGGGETVVQAEGF